MTESERPESRSRSSLFPYIAVVGLVAAAIGGRLLLDPILDSRYPFVTYFMAVLIAATQFGLRPALLATVLGAAAVSYFLLPPRGSFAIDQDTLRVGLILNLLVAAGIAVLGGRLRAAKDRAMEMATTEQRQQLRYRSVLDNALDGIISIDTCGTIESFNPAAERIFGYAAAEVVGTSIMRLIPPDRHAEEMRILQRIVRGETVEHFETLRLRKDGRVIDVSVAVSPITDVTGEVIGASRVIRDISARKHAEEALRHTQARYRTLFEYAPDGILIADANSRYLEANASACRMLGYARDELVGLRAIDIIAPAEADHVAETLAVVNAHGDHHRAWQFRRKDGSTFSADVIATLMPDGNILAMVRDLTDRNRAIEALQAAEERMRFALENAEVGIWDLDYTTGVLRWSPILERQYGLEPGTFAGTVEAAVACIHPDDRAATAAAFEKAVTSGADFSIQHRALWPDGTVRWLNGAGRILLDPQGAPLRGVGISQDVTDRHTLEAQYQQAQKMEAIGRLAGGIAHDFNNLLTAIVGHCELLLADLSPHDPRHADVSEIQKAGARAAALTRQLLAFSRKQIIEPTVLDVNAVISGIRTMLTRLLGENIGVVFQFERDRAFVRADRGQLEQVLVNLAVNARDAMSLGGTLTIGTAHVAIDTNDPKTHLDITPGPYVVLTVSDTGTGMTPEVQARLFEPFFTTKEVGKGTGLGLATVHGVVKRSGGFIDVSSEVGRGTSFKVYLHEVAETGRGAGKSPESGRDSLEGSETVLVVEDADGLRQLARKLLERQGYRVLLAADANEAIEIVNRTPRIDVVLTDVVMPGASGPELTTKLLEQRPDLKVIFMSGYTEDAIVRHGIVGEGVSFLQKPFTSDTLGRKIREALATS